MVEDLREGGMEGGGRGKGGRGERAREEEGGRDRRDERLNCIAVHLNTDGYAIHISLTHIADTVEGLLEGVDQDSVQCSQRILISFVSLHAHF